MMRSGNPALNKNTFKSLTNTSGRVMTLDGAVNKTAISLTILLASAYYTYTLPIESASNFVWPGLIGGFVIALVTIFKKEWSPITVPIYAVLEGLAMGGISLVYAPHFGGLYKKHIPYFRNHVFSIICYKTNVIKPTENFKLGVFAATGGIAIVYLVSLVMSFFGNSGGLAIMDPTNSSMLSIGFSLFVVIIASLNLVMDFDFIEESADEGAPKYMEWYGAFGLLVTLVWLYLEILRLLAKLSSRD